jgi:hypothetical protein
MNLDRAIIEHRVPRHRSRPIWSLLATCLPWVVAAGCGAKSTFEFDELDLVRTQEELTEFPLGKYAIPIPVAAGDSEDSHQLHNHVQLDFELIAVVKRDHQSRISDSWKRHEGKIRDRVIRVCRNSSPDDLEELRAHLMDAVQAQLGDKEIRQLVIAEVKSQPL